MKQRIVTALVLIPIAVAVILLLPTSAFAALTACLWLLALWEWSRLIGLVTVPARGALMAFGSALLGMLWW
ncbi:MAG: phosphatidate cytidylyltransferase, partial [Dokdonella sp.]